MALADMQERDIRKDYGIIMLIIIGEIIDK